MKTVTIDSEKLHYRELNEKIHEVLPFADEIIINNAMGQRYIADAVTKKVKFVVNGIPGNDLAAFMDGPEIIVHGYAQDAIGNTMNSGMIVVHGNAGDIAGYSMRGGKIYVRGNAGYRVGIHMKEYKENFPVVIVGGEVKDFFGEYMAGGLAIVLGLGSNKLPVGDFVGTGMHGGRIIIRAEKIDSRLLGKEVKAVELAKEDRELLEKYIKDYCKYFKDLNAEEILSSKFLKLYPFSHRPYGRLYAY